MRRDWRRIEPRTVLTAPDDSGEKFVGEVRPDSASARCAPHAGIVTVSVNIDLGLKWAACPPPHDVAPQETMLSERSDETCRVFWCAARPIPGATRGIGELGLAAGRRHPSELALLVRRLLGHGQHERPDALGDHGCGGRAHPAGSQQDDKSVRAGGQWAEQRTDAHARCRAQFLEFNVPQGDLHGAGSGYRLSALQLHNQGTQALIGGETPGTTLR